MRREDVPELDPNGYNLNFHEKFYPLGLLNGLDPEREMTVGDAVQNLKSTYCGVTGYEFMYVEVRARTGPRKATNSTSLSILFVPIILSTTPPQLSYRMSQKGTG